MVGEDKIQYNNSSGNNSSHNSMFKIMDRIMYEVNKSKKIFMFMFFSMMILPVTTIIIFIYTFDNPVYDRKEVRENIQEYDILSQKMKNYFLSIENLPQSERAEKLEMVLNSPDYIDTKDRIDELSQSEIKMAINDNKTNLYKKEIRFITFILSLIWIILGIRQYIVLSSWNNKYKNFKNEQEEINKRLDFG